MFRSIIILCTEEKMEAQSGYVTVPRLLVTKAHTSWTDRCPGRRPLGLRTHHCSVQLGLQATH